MSEQQSSMIVDRSDSDNDIDIDMDSGEIQPNSDSIARKSPEPSDMQEPSTSTAEAENVSESSSDQVPSNGDDKMEPVIDTCRLRNGLNEHCLIHIFKFLEVYDLIQLCNTDIYYQNLIAKFVIPSKMISFAKMKPCWTTLKIFQVFGKTMRMIRIEEKSTMYRFDLFLRLIIEYCSVDTLTNMEFYFSRPFAPAAILEETKPFFTNLRKLMVVDIHYENSYEEFLRIIAGSAHKLTHLILQGVIIEGDWLTAGGLENLIDVRMHSKTQNMNRIRDDQVAEFLRTKPKLQCFSFSGTDPVDLTIDSVAMHCPELIELNYFRFLNRYNDESLITTQMKQRFQFMGKMKGLKVVGLTSWTLCHSDLYYPFLKLAAENTVEEIKIFYNPDVSIRLPSDVNLRCPFLNVTSLTSVELRIQCSRNDFQFESDFVCQYMLKQPKVEEFIVISTRTVNGIYKVIDFAPHITRMNVSKLQITSDELGLLIDTIQKQPFLKTAMGEFKRPPICLRVSDVQWAHFRQQPGNDEKIFKKKSNRHIIYEIMNVAFEFELLQPLEFGPTPYE